MGTYSRRPHICVCVLDWMLSVFHTQRSRETQIARCATTKRRRIQFVRNISFHFGYSDNWIQCRQMLMIDQTMFCRIKLNSSNLRRVHVFMPCLCRRILELETKKFRREKKVLPESPGWCKKVDILRKQNSVQWKVETQSLANEIAETVRPAVHLINLISFVPLDCECILHMIRLAATPKSIIIINKLSSISKSHDTCFCCLNKEFLTCEASYSQAVWWVELAKQEFAARLTHRLYLQ